LLPSRQPGALARLAGVEVEDYYALDEIVPVEGKWLNGSAKQWAERLRLVDAQHAAPIAWYGKSNGWLDGQVAVAVHPHGKGTVYTVGAYLDEEAQQTFMEHLLQTAGLEGMDSPQDVEICTRIARHPEGVDPAGRAIRIVINHARAERSLSLPYPMREHFSGQRVEGELKLAPYGVAVLTEFS
jgi:beta-galactosidase